MTAPNDPNQPYHTWGAPWPPQIPPPPPRKSHPVRWALGLIGLAVLVAIIITAAVGASSKPATAPAAVQTHSSAPQTAAGGVDDPLNTAVPTIDPGTVTVTPMPLPKPKPKPKPAPIVNVLDRESGDGLGQSSPFEATGAFDVKYSYDCATFGQAGNFQIWVGDGASILVNALDTSGAGVAHDYEDGGGQVYLTINSECSWSIVVTEATQ